ncbi:hypothetical protein LguiA_020778 [Lonicera macranthoides]
MDIDVGWWILEYLLRQPIDDRTLNSLISVLPLSNTHSTLKRTILVRRIESIIQKCTISEKLLEFLEQIEELNYREGIHITEKMKRAYCAVAVHCTLRLVEENEGIEIWKYFDKMWVNRVCKIEGLGSEELRRWKGEIEKGILDESVRKKLLLRNYGNDAVEVVRVYVEEETERMGPSFLELVAEKLGDFGTLRRVIGFQENGICDQETESLAKIVKETRQGNLPPRSKRLGGKNCRVAKISDTAGFKDRVEEVIDPSSLGPEKADKDPLTDALHLLAETAIASMEREKPDHEPEVGNRKRDDVNAQSSSGDRCVDAVQFDQSVLGNPRGENWSNEPNPSLMALNSTARSHEKRYVSLQWEDSIDHLPNWTRVQVPSPRKRVVPPLKKNEISPNRTRFQQVPSPRKMVVSASKNNEIPKLWKRRKIKRWNTLEKDTLWTGVQKYGKGNWKLILNMYRSIFEERTEVDLKDKWRNLTRYR